MNCIKKFSRIVCVSLFSYQGCSLSCDSLFNLPHLSLFVNNFFQVFENFFPMCVVVLSPTACIPYHVFSILSRVIFNFLKLSLVFCVSESIISDSQINLPQTHMAVNTFFKNRQLFFSIFSVFTDWQNEQL